MTVATENERAIYERDGVVPLGPLLSAEEVAEARWRLERIMAEHRIEDQGGERGQFFRVVCPSTMDDWYARLLHYQGLLDRVAAAFGPGIQYFQDQVFVKPARVGAPTHYHQDNVYWHLDPPHAATVWIALDDATVANGAVHYLAGSHAKLLTPDGPPQVVDGQTRPGELTDAQRASFKVLTWDVPAGHGVIHHCQTIHGAPPNTSPTPRRGYTLHITAPGLAGDRPLLREG